MELQREASLKFIQPKLLPQDVWIVHPPIHLQKSIQNYSLQKRQKDKNTKKDKKLLPQDVWIVRPPIHLQKSHPTFRFECFNLLEAVIKCPKLDFSFSV